MPSVEAEVEKFSDALSKAEQQRLQCSIEEMFDGGDAEGLASLLAGADPAPLQAVFEGVGLDAVMELRRTDRKMFITMVQSLAEQGRAFAGVWPPAVRHLEELQKRLEAVAKDPGEERMVRWRARGLLKILPTPRAS